MATTVGGLMHDPVVVKPDITTLSAAEIILINKNCCKEFVTRRYKGRGFCK